MLNRLFTALMIVSTVAALAVAVLWWRANHGHSDTFHLGPAFTTTPTTFTTAPGGRIVVEVESRNPMEVQSQMRFYDLRTVFGGCLFIPGLWAAVQIRRRLLPRRPGSELPALGRR